MTVYTAYAFGALGASATRTDPARLSDVVNVEDWGAVGNAVTNDAAAIQSAINYCMSTKPNGSKGGMVFFPPGQYNLGTTPLVVGSSDSTISLSLIGCGGNPAANTSLVCTVADYVVSQGVQTYDNLIRFQGIGITNNSTSASSGCIKITGTCVYIQGVSLAGMNPINAASANGACIMDCNGQGSDGHHAAGVVAPVLAQTGVGMYLGNNCFAIDCRFTGGLFIGYALSGTGCGLIGTSSEVLNIAVRVGWGPSGETACVGAVVQGFQTERCDVSLDIYNATACVFEANQWTGPNGVPSGQRVTLAWAAGTVTATTLAAAPHNLFAMYGTTTHRLQMDAITNATTWTNSQVFVNATVPGASTTTFTFPGPAINPGASPAAPEWTYPIHYGIRCRLMSGCVILTNQTNPNACIASMDMDYDGAAIHSNNIMQATNGALSGWILPRAANRAAWKFLDCGANSVTNNSEHQATASPYGFMNFADLPGGASSSNQPGPFEGQEYDIIDAPVIAVGSNVTVGGGANHYRVRYNGTNWTRMG